MNAPSGGCRQSRRMSKRTRAVRRSRAEWAALLEACTQSGLSYSAFAEREGIHPKTLTGWASKLGAGVRRRSQKPVDASSSSVDTSRFVPVHVRSTGPTRARVASELARPSAARTACSGGVEVVLANGRRVRCELEQVDDPRLAALLRLAEGSSPC